MRERDHLGDPGVHWWIYNSNIDFQGVEWVMVLIDVAQDRDIEQPLVNVLMNLRIP